MAKNYGMEKGSPAVFVLQLAGSIVYMWLVFAKGNYLLQISGLWTIWAPLLFGIAAATSIALFFISISNYIGILPAKFAGLPVTVGGGVSLLALSATSNAPAGFGSPMFYAAVAGFAIALVGDIASIRRFFVNKGWKRI